MKFKVSIINHRRLRPFLKRAEKGKWVLWKEKLNKPRWKFLSVEGSVDISYLELFKHISIGGDLYTSREIESDLEGGTIEFKKWTECWKDNESLSLFGFSDNEKYQKAYKEATSEQFLKDWIDKIKWSYLKIKNNLEEKNFKKMRDETKTGYLSYEIGQWIATYLASEIDNVFFTLPYDYVCKILELDKEKNIDTNKTKKKADKTKKKADLVAFIWQGVWEKKSYRGPFCILLEAKGRSNKNITSNQKEKWKEQKNANKKELEAKYGIISAIYNLYDKDENPKCLYIDPERSSGYKLEIEDYGKLLNLYYAPLKTLIRTLEKKEIKEIEMKIHNGEKEEIKKQAFYIIRLKDMFHDIVDEKISLYLRKQFVDFDDWRYWSSYMSEGAKIQNDNLYIDYDWIWFGIDDYS